MLKQDYIFVLTCTLIIFFSLEEKMALSEGRNNWATMSSWLKLISILLAACQVAAATGIINF